MNNDLNKVPESKIISFKISGSDEKPGSFNKGEYYRYFMREENGAILFDAYYLTRLAKEVSISSSAVKGEDMEKLEGVYAQYVDSLNFIEKRDRDLKRKLGNSYNPSPREKKQKKDGEPRTLYDAEIEIIWENGARLEKKVFVEDFYEAYLAADALSAFDDVSRRHKECYYISPAKKVAEGNIVYVSYNQPGGMAMSTNYSLREKDGEILFNPKAYGMPRLSGGGDANANEITASREDMQKLTELCGIYKIAEKQRDFAAPAPVYIDPPWKGTLDRGSVMSRVVKDHFGDLSAYVEVRWENGVSYTAKNIPYGGGAVSQFFGRLKARLSPGGQAPAKKGESWTCECGQADNDAIYCVKCADPKPDVHNWKCPSCGAVNPVKTEAPKNKYCPNCGTPRPKSRAKSDTPKPAAEGNVVSFKISGKNRDAGRNSYEYFMREENGRILFDASYRAYPGGKYKMSSIEGAVADREHMEKLSRLCDKYVRDGNPVAQKLLDSPQDLITADVEIVWENGARFDTKISLENIDYESYDSSDDDLTGNYVLELFENISKPFKEFYYEKPEGKAAEGNIVSAFYLEGGYRPSFTYRLREEGSEIVFDFHTSIRGKNREKAAVSKKEMQQANELFKELNLAQRQKNSVAAAVEYVPPPWKQYFSVETVNSTIEHRRQKKKRLCAPSMRTDWENGVYFVANEMPDDWKSVKEFFRSLALRLKCLDKEDYEDADKESAAANAPRPATVSQTGAWTCSCGCNGNTGKFCTGCGTQNPDPMPAPVKTPPAPPASVMQVLLSGSKPPTAGDGWTCSCKTANEGKFCVECGRPKPVDQ